MDTNKLSKKIKLPHTALNLTQAQLSPKINSKQKSISRYETDASLLYVETLAKKGKKGTVLFLYLKSWLL